MIYIDNLNYNIKVFVTTFCVVTNNPKNYIKVSTLIFFFKIFVIFYKYNFMSWFTQAEFVHHYDLLIEQSFHTYFLKLLQVNNLISIKNDKYFIKIKWKFLF